MMIIMCNHNGEREVKADQLYTTINQIAHMAETNPSFTEIGRVDFYDADGDGSVTVTLEGLGGNPALKEWRLIPHGIEGEGYFTPWGGREAALILKLIFMGSPTSRAAFAACFPHTRYVATRVEDVDADAKSFDVEGATVSRVDGGLTVTPWGGREGSVKLSVTAWTQVSWVRVGMWTARRMVDAAPADLAAWAAEQGIEYIPAEEEDAA